MTLIPLAERLAVDPSLPVFTTYVGRGWDSNTQLSACGVSHSRGRYQIAINCCATVVKYMVCIFSDIDSIDVLLKKNYTQINNHTYN